jgi:epoxyqueuosine reductase
MPGNLVFRVAFPIHETDYANMALISSIPLDSSRARSDTKTLAPVAISRENIRELALSVGFTEAGIVGLPHADAERDETQFRQFVDEGRAGSMHYLARLDDQQRLVRSRVDIPFPWARSVVVCLAGYNADAPLSTEKSDAGAGWIARYAWSGKKGADGALRPSDYHKVLLKRLRALEAEMRGAFGDFESRAYVDTGPVVERSLARAAGLGWTGKNTCLIHPKLGSWNFLAVIVTSLEMAEEQVPLSIPDRCGSCRRCLDACPTGALTESYRMDATLCISYLTIEHRGEIPEDLRAVMGRQVFGCDICQDVCPWNRKAPIGVDAESDLAPRRELFNPDLEWLAALRLADFERLFNGSPIRRAGFAGLRRNVAIAMGNSGLTRFLPRLERWASDQRDDREDPQTPEHSSGQDEANSAAVRDAARWALDRITQGIKHAGSQ